MLAAYALSRVRYKYNDWLNKIPLIGYLFPPIVLVISYGAFLRQSPLNQTLIGVILAHVAFCLPFGVWLMVRYFEAIPRQFDMAARADGAAWWKALWHVLRKRAMPGIVAVAMFSFILSWNDVVLSLYLTPQLWRTLPAWIDDLIRTEAASRYGDIAAASAFLSSVAIIVLGSVSVWLDNAIRREAKE
jgi:multiple sugar transport system permease protein